MFDWLKRRSDGGELPAYSEVWERPTRGLPPDLEKLEAGEKYRARHSAIEQDLRSTPLRPMDDAVMFIALIGADRKGVVTIPAPDGGPACIPIFSSPIRVADYVRMLLSHGTRLNFLTLSPAGLVDMLTDLRRAGVGTLTMDRCPRCNCFATLGSESAKTPDDVINIWSIFKAGELARLELYLSYARESARAGRLDLARQVALETAAHVSLEDPRVHQMLGRIAVAQKDRKLFDEAKRFLRYRKLEAAERELDEAMRSGSPGF